jgi:Na+:H+ antiporter, NhaA family
MADDKRVGARKSAVRRFFGTEAAGGLLLMAAAAAALIVANSDFGEAYRHLLHVEIGPTLTPKLGAMTVELWVNDGLIALFFLLVGLEIKREFLDGNLASWDRRRLPLIAAATGMALPALLYLGVAGGDPLLQRGWAIPAATDIAFALGVLTLLGPRVPASLKLFLATVAIADNLGAVAIIALFYTDALDFGALAAAALILAGLFALGRFGVTRLWIYLLGAALLWYATLLSGVHATVAGVLAACAVPLVRTPAAPDADHSPLHRLEHGLAPWVGFLILPVFGFVNAGVSLAGLGPAALLAPLPLGIAVGLFVGKQLAIFAAVRLSVAFRLAARPQGATWLQVYGIAMLCGIGFTMSLFIGTLAFPGQPLLVEEAKLGILLGSGLSAIGGFLLLGLTGPGRRALAEHEEFEASD